MEVGFWAALAELDIRTVIIGVLLLLLSAVVYAILRGKLVPRSTLLDTQKERDLLWQAYRESEQTRQAVASLLDKVIAQGTVTNELLNQLRYGSQK